MQRFIALKQLYGVVLACCACTLVQPLTCQVAPADEAAIRRVYARLAFATEINAVEESQAATAAQLNSDMAGKVLQFQITSLTGGPITEIEGRPLTSFAHYLNRDVIHVGFVTKAGKAAMGDAVSIDETASAEWKEGHPDADTFPDSFTVKDMMVGQFPLANRYVQASLIVTLAGRSRAYQSFFLFDPKGVKFAFDPIVGETALTKFLVQPVYPSYLLKVLPQTSAARLWLKGKQVAGCSDADPKECCDSTTCGIHASDIPAVKPSKVAVSGAAPLDVAPVGCSQTDYSFLIGYNDTNRYSHVTGYHGMVGDKFGTCVYTQPVSGSACLTVANATITACMNETGVVTPVLYLHNAGSTTSGTAMASGSGLIAPVLLWPAGPWKVACLAES